ncbi:ABC-2 type transport system ATP-binding protein [Enterococcus sp. PF1-24]|uniref:ABC transporter ATP-binding protein n=1 Tax=unclassified Enterococcus TaxID=2608891 RepID=UPI002476335C|nr:MULTISPECIES: ABC transporter ATP-binding protein [unclassified Enterococcus]MDH6363733.1 ABC-2 type transport system ATP-binding protein [Enterococcus sp. PFB1-1]MDH6400689.1 ABC-2 type transport system ATP-binding protein [Enterococcus sp. PF1-24]
MKEVLLKLNHISKTFAGRQALKDINMMIHEGEILGFLGPSGAGKTTTIKIVTGQLVQSSGEATILNSDTRKINEEIYEKIGIVTDASGIYEEFTVYDNLLLFAQLLKVETLRIDELLERVGLKEQRNQMAGKLSKGQTQRLVLARAVLHKPKLLFLDEPTSGLDPSTALDIHKLLLELKDDGMGIFLTTHNMEEATKLCDHVALLNDGNIVEFGTPKEICLRYNSDKKYRVLLNSQEEVILSQNPAQMAQLHEWLITDEVEAVHSCEPTLENVFLTVTGRELQ